MYQMPATAWNRIPRESLRSNWAKIVFSLDQETMDRLVEAVEKALERRKIPDRVITAYMEVLPLLVEHKALRVLGESVPEVLTRKEAVLLMTREKHLGKTEQKALMELLPKTVQDVWTVWRKPMEKTILSEKRPDAKSRPTA